MGLFVVSINCKRLHVPLVAVDGAPGVQLEPKRLHGILLPDLLELFGLPSLFIPFLGEGMESN